MINHNTNYIPLPKRLSFPMKTLRSDANRWHLKSNFEFRLSNDFELFQTNFDVIPNVAILNSPKKMIPIE